MVIALVFGCTSDTKSDMELMMCQLDAQLNALNLEVWSLPNYIFLFGAVSSLREATLAFGMLFICNLRAI